VGVRLGDDSRGRHEGHEAHDSTIRLDLIVERCVVVEVKSVGALAPIHRAQVLTYLRLSKLPVGLLLNFNSELLRHGVRRILNG